MPPLEVLACLHRRGVIVVPDGDGRLRYHPRNALSVAEQTLLVREREAVLAHFEADPIGWRVAVMATQVRPGQVLPLLLARPGIRFPLHTCCSCGDPLGPADHYRCSPCTAAHIAAIESVSWSWRVG